MEIEKVSTLRGWLPKRDRLKNSDPIFFRVAGMPVSIRCWGENPYRNATFLQQYLAPFLAHDSQPKISLNYFSAPDATGEGHHPFWNETDPEFRAVSKFDDETYVVQRDFVALMSKSDLEAWAQGPHLHAQTSDTIDNFLMFVISRHLFSGNALALHASTVEKDGFAYVFFGASGAGKSTLALHCYRTDRLRILGGDQIYLQKKDSELIAHPTPTSFPELSRTHPARCYESLPVKGLIHLVQKGVSSFCPLNGIEALTFFLRETIYQPQFGNPTLLLDLATQIVQTRGIVIGEMSYPKGSPFWSLLA